jgi:hypothetical protein
LKNPFRSLFKPKEKPDNPLDRIPEEWKRSNQTKDEDQTNTSEAQKKRGRPAKKVVAPTPQPNVVDSKPEKIKPRYRPVKFKSNIKKLNFRPPQFREIPSFRSIMRGIAIFLLVCISISVYTLFFTAPIYILITMVDAVVLLDYIWITKKPKVEPPVHLKTGAELSADKREDE